MNSYESRNLCPGKFLGILGRYPTVSKSNWVHGEILRFLFNRLEYILFLKKSAIFWSLELQPDWVMYFSNSTGSCCNLAVGSPCSLVFALLMQGGTGALDEVPILQPRAAATCGTLLLTANKSRRASHHRSDRDIRDFIRIPTHPGHLHARASGSLEADCEGRAR